MTVVVWVSASVMSIACAIGSFFPDGNAEQIGIIVNLLFRGFFVEGSCTDPTVMSCGTPADLTGLTLNASV